MPDETDTINADDPMIRVLTDALRAGPGTAEWRAAAEQLPPDGYEALLAARDRLAGGKSYRSVRPGPGFTRKVMASIADDGDVGLAKVRSPISAGFLGYIAAGAVVVGLVLVLKLLLRAGGATTEDLGGVFNTQVASTDLRGPLGDGWRRIGPLSVDPSRGLAPATVPAADGVAYLGGGIVTAKPVPAEIPIAILAKFTFAHVSDDCVPELFVTDAPDFDSKQATGGHELTWVVRGGHANVVTPDGSLVGGPLTIADGQTVTVRIAVGENEAQVTVDDKPLWVGTSGLFGRPRFAGVRLLRRHAAKDARDAVVVHDLRVAEP